jgi:hypothetical protein
VIEGYRNQFFGDQIREEEMPEYFKDLVQSRVLHALARAHYYRQLFQYNLRIAKIHLVSASDVYQSLVEETAAGDAGGPGMGNGAGRAGG